MSNVPIRRRPSSSTTGEQSSGSALKQKQDGHVKVAVRCRPMSAREIKDGHKSIVEFEDGHRVIVNNIGESPSDQLGTRSGERSNLAQVYEFDAVFDRNCSQETIYNSVCKPIVDSVLEGYNGTIFAYGQTGTGKTYTMEGQGNRRRAQDQEGESRRASDVVVIPTRQSAVVSSGSRRTKPLESASKARLSAGTTSYPERRTGSLQSDTESRGVIPRAFEHIFERIAERKDVQFLVRASYMEIYQEEIHDLLKKQQQQQQQQGRQKLKLHERPDTGVYVKDLTSYVCKSIDEIERVMRVGNQNRKVGATDMNEHSSRSHAIFIITIEQQSHQSAAAAASSETINVKQQQQQRNDLSQSSIIRVGRLNLVDLAGSERQRKTNNSGQRHKESIKINLSLSALGNVINSLMKINGQQQSNKTTTDVVSSKSADSFHVPYRDSKLTRLLQDSLGGNSRTLMIANIGPASYNYDETINTLNYASRAKCIQNRPRLNEDPKDALLRQLQGEIQELRAKLANSQANNSAANYKHSSNGSIMRHRQSDSVEEQEFLELKAKLASLEAKLLNGEETTTGSLADRLDQRLLEGYTRKQADELERNKVQLMDQADREKRIRQELERREEAQLEIQQSFSSVQQEVDTKRALIRQVLLKTKALRDELEVTQNAYRQELDELDQLQYVLQKELRLKCLIMDNFIPNHHVNQLLPRISYDDKRDSCSVEPIDLPLDYCNLDSESLIQYPSGYGWQQEQEGVAHHRARSELERIGSTINPNDARYKYDNILDLRVIPPSQFAEPAQVFASTKSLATGDTINQPSKIQTLIEAVLNQHEPDIVI